MPKCENCGDEIGFDEEWSEEDALEEYKKNFPDDPNMEVPTAGICDDCYEKFKKWREELSPERRNEYDNEALESKNK